LYTSEDDTDLYDHKDALRPVTIRQILDAYMPHPREPLHIGGKKVTKITVVAHVREEIIKDVGSLRMVQYMLEDGTGNISAFHDTKINSSLVVCDSKLPYIRITGYIQTFGATKSRTLNRVKVDSVRAVTDPHEIYFHLLEVTMVTARMGSPPAPRSREDGDTSQDFSAAELSSAQLPTTQDNHYLHSVAQEGSEGTHSEVAEMASSPAGSIRSSESFETAFAGDDLPSPIIPPLDALQIEDQYHLRDPLSHLDNIQRDILLAIYKNHDNYKTDEDGNTGVYVKDIADLLDRHNLSGQQIADILDDMIDMEVIIALDKERMFYRPADAQHELHYRHYADEEDLYQND